MNLQLAGTMKHRASVLLIASMGCVTQLPESANESSRLTGTTIVSLTFDDTFAAHFQAASMLETRGMRGTFYVNSPRFGRSGYLTLDQARTLEASGHEIAGHTLDHSNLTTVTVEEAQRQICDDRDALLALGFDVTSFAYPFGADNATVQRIVGDCNYNSARDVGGLVVPTSCSSCPYANPIPPPNLYQVRTNGSVRSSTTLDTLKLYVTQAEQNGGGWVPFIFHHICDGCDEYSVSASTLGAFLDWLQSRAPDGVEVATVHQVIGGTVLPPADGGSTPPPPPPSDTVAPTVRVLAPTAGSVVGRNTWFVAEATDNVGVVRVRFRVDGNVIAERTSTPYKVKLGPLARGTHELSVQALDAAGNTGTSASVTVTAR